MIDAKQAKMTADFLAGIAEPTRIRIIDALKTGPKHVTEIATVLNIEIVNASHHLGVMRQNGLVQDEKKGRFVIYSLSPLFQAAPGGATVASFGWCNLEIQPS